ncbi:MAG: peptidylprolyl isomerase [Pseudomonadota bacterium]
MKRLLAATAICAFGAFPVFADGHEAAEVGPETVLATVNGSDITLGHLIAIITELPPDIEALPDEVIYAGLLDQLIQQELLAGIARSDMTALRDLGLQNETRRYLAASLITEIALAPVTDEEVEALYDEIFGAIEPSTEYNASHILLETEEEAAEVIALLDEGGDFAELAAEYSIGPTGPRGGELGWFGQGTMIEPFENAVIALEVGAISEPVETQFGWHVIRLNETREEQLPTVDDLRAELEESVRQDRVDARIAELTAEGEVVRPELEFDLSVIRDAGLLTGEGDDAAE